MKTTMTQDQRDLLSEFLLVCNEAIAAHEDEVLQGTLFELQKRMLVGKTIGVEIYEEDREHPLAHFTVELGGHAFRILGAEGSASADLTWRLRRSTMQDVVDHRQEYIDHPLKLDWAWLKARLGG